MKVNRFEDLIAWQKARELTRDIYLATRTPIFARDFGLCGQIQRASVSIMSNIPEGFERGSARDFHRFLTISKSSCAEVRSELYVALDVDHIKPPLFDGLYLRAEEVGRILGGLMVSVSRRREEI